MRLEPVTSFEAIRTEWSALAETAGSFFGTPEWLETWWRHHGKGRRLLLHACRGETGELIAVLPLYVWRTRPRVIRFLGHGPGDELGPVNARSDAAVAVYALRQLLDELVWDVFLGEQLPGDGNWPTQLEMPRWRTEESPRLATPVGGWESYVHGRSANSRQQLARRRRALDAAGACTFRLSDDRSLEHDLDVLFELHRRRWGRMQTDFTDTPFQRDVAREAARHGRLRLWLLDLDGSPVAAWLGFHIGGVTSYYQAGREPALDSLSVGGVLLAHTIQAAMDEGATEYRLGRGGEAFKYRFADDDPGLVSVAAARGPIGHGALAGAKIARGARTGARRLRGTSAAATIVARPAELDGRRNEPSA